MADEANSDAHAVVVIEPADHPHVQELAMAHGVSVETLDEHGFEPVATITLLLFGSVVAIGAVQQAIDEHNGGHIIDLRPGAPRREYRDRNVKYGLILVYTADGDVRVEIKEPKGAFGQVVDAVRTATVELGSAGLETVAKAVTAAASIRATAALAAQAIGHHTRRDAVEALCAGIVPMGHWHCHGESSTRGPDTRDSEFLSLPNGRAARRPGPCPSWRACAPARSGSSGQVGGEDFA